MPPRNPQGTEETEASADVGDLDVLAGYLKVLSNPKRLHLLQFLTQPHYLEEIASELKMARQTAQEHVQQLQDLGVIKRIQGRRDHGPVTDYVVVPQRLFTIHEEFGKLGVLEPRGVENSEALRPATSPLETGVGVLEAQDRPRLVIVHGMRIGQSLALTGQGPWLIGRDAHATVCLDYDPFVSSRHAELRRVPGGFDVADLYSVNGTFVDWKRMPRGTTQRLQSGAILRAGKTLLLFREST